MSVRCLKCSGTSLSRTASTLQLCSRCADDAFVNVIKPALAFGGDVSEAYALLRQRYGYRRETR